MFNPFKEHPGIFCLFNVFPLGKRQFSTHPKGVKKIWKASGYLNPNVKDNFDELGRNKAE